MFRIAQSPTFWAKVKTGATDENGKRVTGEFEVKCKRLSLSEIRALADRTKDVEGPDSPDFAFLSEVVTDWRYIAGEDGTAMEFSVENLRAVCDAGFSADIVRGFYDCLPGARAKN